MLSPVREPGESVQRLTRCTWCRTEYWTETSAAHGATESEYWESYKFALYSDPAVRSASESRYAAAMALLPTRPVRLLDIGGGIGNFADWARREGYESITSDVNASAVETARKRGLTAWTADELDDHVPDGFLDLVSLWDVVEHLVAPGDVLALAAAKLRPGGTLLLETPDVRFPLRAFVLAAHRLTWGRLDFTHPLYYWEHKTYFSESGLRTLCWKHGLAVEVVARWTSPAAKMAATFGEQAAHYGDPHGAKLYALLRRAYPIVEKTSHSFGLGNKLIVAARRTL
jgi:2-polyprenyl-3-methyl-5-hydroxy-6-metoxy-1,4-benzoquinol methylase